MAFTVPSLSSYHSPKLTNHKGPVPEVVLMMAITRWRDAASLKRLALALVLFLYSRKTWRSLRENHRQLKAGADPRSAAKPLARRVLKYTFLAQLLAACEYLLVLVKPAVSLRIGQTLVWTGRQEARHLRYAHTHERQTLDLYGVDKSSKRPMLVFVHGGAWSFGHKWQYALVGSYLSAALGTLVAVVNYRTYPSGSVLDMVEDVDNAVRLRAGSLSLSLRR